MAKDEQTAERERGADGWGRFEAQLRHNSDTFYRLIKNNPFGVYLVDADFRLREVSQGAQKVFSNVRPLIGRDFAEVLRIVWAEPFASEAIARFQHTLDSGESFQSPRTVECRGDTREIEAYDWRIDRITLPDGRFGVVCYFYDLSERQRYEEALRQADRRKDEFLAILAHELRNPLAPIRQAAAIARQPSATPAQVRWSHELIERQVRHMALLLDDLLDVSRITRGRLELNRTRLTVEEAVQAAVETARPHIESRRHALDVTLPGEPLALDGDPLRVAQVLSNLLTNAAKYTEPDGRIGLTARRAEASVEITVSDNGIGIAADQLERVFEMFVQGPSPSHRSDPGLGIGLSLARGLVELHGGTLQARSAGVGQGAQFVVRLPLAEVAPTR